MDLKICRLYLSRIYPVSGDTRWHASFCRDYGIGQVSLHAGIVRIEVYWNL